MQNSGNSLKKRRIADRSKRRQGLSGLGRVSGKSARERNSVTFQDARGAALFVLNSMEKKRWTLDAALEAFSERFELPSRDQALYHAIVHGVLRWRGALDPVIAYFASRPLVRVEPDILNILRIALFQIRYLDKIPVSAAVDTAVSLTRRIARPRAAGFVNALLRTAVSTPWESLLPDAKIDPVGWLSQSRSFPDWLVSRWVDRMGFSRTKDFCDRQNEIPPITVRVNRLKISRERLIQALKEDCNGVWACRFSLDGVSFTNPARTIPEMIAFKKGWFQVQDEAAQLVTQLLDPRPGETVLDACAGLGGKTGHIAQRMKNSGRLFAWDINAKKLARLSGEMDRLGATSVTVEKKNLGVSLGENCHLRFDRILLDAPCSGLGVLRRNPDARWRTVEADLNRHRQIQLRMLNHASILVKPSGVLVYAVCSAEPEENESVMDAFLKKHPEFMLYTRWLDPSGPIKELGKPSLYLKTNPLDHGMDGFFAARLERRP